MKITGTKMLFGQKMTLKKVTCTKIAVPGFEKIATSAVLKYALTNIVYVKILSTIGP